jgi:hypothetical protein
MSKELGGAKPQAGAGGVWAKVMAARGKLQEIAAHPQLAPIWGALNQTRMELAHFFGKVFPETPQFDDPAAAFNRTPLEGYQLKHGIDPDRARNQELGKDAQVKEPEKDQELDLEK